MQECFCLLHCQLLWLTYNLRASELPVLAESYFLIKGRAYVMRKRCHCIFFHKKEVHGIGQSIWSQWALLFFLWKMGAIMVSSWSYWEELLTLIEGQQWCPDYCYIPGKDNACPAVTQVNMNKMNETGGYQWTWLQSSMTSSLQMNSLT